jgi:hypothetical protein
VLFFFLLFAAISWGWFHVQRWGQCSMNYGPPPPSNPC